MQTLFLPTTSIISCRSIDVNQLLTNADEEFPRFES